MMKEEWLTTNEAMKLGIYDKIGKRREGFLLWIRAGYITSKEFHHKTRNKISLHMKKSDLDNLSSLIELLGNEYMCEKEAKASLGFSKTVNKEVTNSIIQFCESVNIDYKFFEEGFLFKSQKNYIFINRKQLSHFLKTHITHEDARKKYNLNFRQINALVNRHNIPRIHINIRFSFYKIEDAEKYFTEHYNEEIHYHLSEVMELLGLKKSQLTVFNSVRESEGLQFITIKKKVYYYKDEIHKLLKKMDEIRSEYGSLNDVKRILNVKRFPQKIFTPFPANALSKIALGEYNGIKSIFSLKEVYAHKQEVDLRENIYDSLNGEPIEAFNKIIQLKDISFSDYSKYTMEEWYQYCTTKLSLWNANKTTMKNYVSDLVSCTSILSDLTKETELYALTSNQINLKIFNEYIPRSHQGHIYNFLTEFHAKLNFSLSNLDVKKKTFDMKKITNPRYYEKEEQPKEIYEYEEYIQLYDYAKQMSHKQKAIKDAEYAISKDGKYYHYASSWLYVLTHLGNAWRHGDVMDLPIVNLKDLSLRSLDELKKRDLTMEEANLIVNQIKRNDFIVNKTKATTKFNCPDDLVLPLATAILICTFIVEQKIGVISDSNGDTLNNLAIDFNTEKRNEFTPKAQTFFFKSFEIDNFQFQSRKMNRTVLVLMYMILVRKGKGSAALELSQRLRAHEDFETTNIYLVIPDKELDELCESLFNRKPFGYITDLIATVLLGDNEDRKKRTEEITILHNTFGGVLQIESTAGFINKTIAERKKVADKIFEMGVDEATSLMFDLQTNSLPSQEENYQCITSPNCQKPELTSCKECPFAVPNFYAISSLVESIKDTIHEFINNFDIDTFDGEKTHLMNLLYKDMDNLERAMQKFGQEEVFRFFKNGENEYNELLQLLDEAQSRTGEEFEKYLTYEPIYLN